jgi:hypothetical protein
LSGDREAVDRHYQEVNIPLAKKAAGNLEGKRLFACSDRDHGNFVFQYTAD